MSRHSAERKTSVLKTSCCHPTLGAKQVVAIGEEVSGREKLTSKWSAEAKLAVVIEAADLVELELSEYCREKGL